MTVLVLLETRVSIQTREVFASINTWISLWDDPQGPPLLHRWCLPQLPRIHWTTLRLYGILLFFLIRSTIREATSTSIHCNTIPNTFSCYGPYDIHRTNNEEICSRSTSHSIRASGTVTNIGKRRSAATNRGDTKTKTKIVVSCAPDLLRCQELCGSHP